MNLQAVDLFCGAGGLSLGLRQAGIQVRCGVDIDAAALMTYSKNIRSPAVTTDITCLTASTLNKYILPSEPLVLAGGPPCQLFSRLHQRRSPRSPTIESYLSLVARLQPEYLVFENVPNILNYPVWNGVMSRLSRYGYHLWWGVINMIDLGLPQNRRRLILLGCKSSIVVPDWRRREPRTVKQAIGDLPLEDDRIANHIAMQMSPNNRRRIRRTPKDGGRSREDGTFCDSYARMSWNSAAPTITTKCVSFSNGRFGHPEYDRALTVREAARLQGFPDSFVFQGYFWDTAKQVGNAVPPPLSRCVGRLLIRHIAGQIADSERCSKAAEEMGRLRRRN